MEERINQALAQIEKDLQDIKSAKEQVDSVVASSSQLKEKVGAFVSDVSNLSKQVEQLMHSIADKGKDNLANFKESMEGIYSTSVGTGTIDESPMAYKDPKEILRLIEDTVEVEYFIRPVINLKATNSYDSSVEIDVNEEAD